MLLEIKPGGKIIVLKKIIRKLKQKLGLIKKEKSRLRKVELKLRSMRKIVVQLRDDNPQQEKETKLIREFDKLQQEVMELQKDD